jgi:undecaprenyl-diphosphatase
MTWLQAIDTALFRFINQSLVNPVFDWLMPRLAGHPLFVPLVLAGAVWWLWRGGARGRVCVLALALAVAVADGLVCNPVKKAIQRPRPCLTLPDARKLLGCSHSGSMPSGHAANWFAATAVVMVYYRRRWGFVAVPAAAVAFSRVYDGVHYPGDVLVGAVLGAGSGFASVWLLDALWRLVGRQWFPLWWRRLPSLANPDLTWNSESADPPGDGRVGREGRCSS